jgi:hypothetical protein
MNKLNLQQGFVTSIEDMSFLQNSIEDGLKSILSTTSDLLTYSVGGSIAVGWEISLPSTTTITLENNNTINLGYAVDANSNILKFAPETVAGLTFSFPTSTVYAELPTLAASTEYVCAIKQLEQLGTEDITTSAIDYVTPGRINLISNVPGQSGGLSHDRLIQNYKFYVFTAAQFTTAQTSTGTIFVELSRFTTTAGAEIDPGTLNTDNTSYLSAIIRDNSITLSKLNPTLQQLLNLLYVQLDKPSFARREDNSANRYLFLDTTKQLVDNLGQNLVLADAEFATQEAVTITAPDKITGARIIKYVNTGAATVNITNTFGVLGDLSVAFTPTAADNSGVSSYGLNLVGITVKIDSIGGVAYSPTDTIDFQISRVSDSVVVATGSKLISSCSVLSWNIAPLTTLLPLTFDVAYKLEVKKTVVNLGTTVLLTGDSSANFDYKIHFRPPAGKYGSRDSGNSVRLYDKYGELDVANATRTANDFRSRYIPYAADLSNPLSFVPYQEPVYQDINYKKYFVAIDVTLGRFIFPVGQQPADIDTIYIMCNFFTKHAEANAVTLQRKSRVSTYYYENIESALERLSQIATAYLFITRNQVPLIPVEPLLDNKYKALSLDINFTDSTGSELSLDKGNLLPVQLKTDQFYFSSNPESNLNLGTSILPPTHAKGYINYLLAPVIADGDVITINGNTYEFDNNAVIGGGNISVPIQVAGNKETIDQLVLAITATDTMVTATHDIGNQWVIIEWVNVGLIGNTIDFTEDVDTNSVFLLKNYTNTTADPLVLTGGGIGSYLEFSPTFSSHKGLVLYTGTSVYNAGVNEYSLEVTLQKGTYDAPVGTPYVATLSGQNIVSNGSVFIEFGALNTVPTVPPALDTTSTYFYLIRKINVVGAGSIEIKRYNSPSPPENGNFKYQYIFETSGGLGGEATGWNLYDDTGSLFLPSILRDQQVDGQNIAFTANPSLVDTQLTGVYSIFPNFTPLDLDSVSTSKFEVFVSEWTTPDLSATLTYRLIDNTTNAVVGTPQTVNVVDVFDSTGTTHPLTSTINPAVTPAGLVTIRLLYATTPLSLSKSYHFEIKYTGSISANLFLATDGTIPGTSNICYKRYYSPVFIPLAVSLGDDVFGSFPLPTKYYVAIDVTRGRFQFHPDAKITTASLILVNKVRPLISFYFKVDFSNLTSESVPRPDGSVVEDSLLFLDKTQHNGVLMMKRELSGDLIVESGYIAATLDDTLITGNIVFEPDSDMFLFQKRNAPFLFWVLSGLAIGWNEEYTIGAGSLQYPQYKTYTNADEIIRMTISYNTDGSYSIVSYEYSSDSGVAYTLLATKTYVYESQYLKKVLWS